MNVKFSEEEQPKSGVRKTPESMYESEERVSVRFIDPAKYLGVRALPTQYPEHEYEKIQTQLKKYRFFPKLSVVFFGMQVIGIVVSAFAVLNYYINGVKECSRRNEQHCTLVYGWIFLVYLAFLFINGFWLWILWVGISSYKKRKAGTMGLVAICWGASTLLNLLVVFIPPLEFWVGMVLPTGIWFYITLRIHLVLEEFELLKPYLIVAGKDLYFED